MVIITPEFITELAGELSQLDLIIMVIVAHPRFIRDHQDQVTTRIAHLQEEATLLQVRDLFGAQVVVAEALVLPPEVHQAEFQEVAAEDGNF